jgi:hypothetical protein
MQPITDITSLLTFEEGDRLFVYDDQTGKPITKGSHCFGNPTIGRGRALNIEGISEAESTYLLNNDVAHWRAELGQFSWYTNLDQVRRDAIVNMAHAQGVAGVEGYHDMIAALVKEHAETVAALQAQDWKAARDAVLTSHWAGEDPERATRCANMLWSGVYPIV